MKTQADLESALDALREEMTLLKTKLADLSMIVSDHLQAKIDDEHHLQEQVSDYMQAMDAANLPA